MIIFTPYTLNGTFFGQFDWFSCSGSLNYICRHTLIAHRINSSSFYHDETNFLQRVSIISQMLIQETKHGHSNKTLMALHLSSEF